MESSAAVVSSGRCAPSPALSRSGIAARSGQ